MSTIKEPKVTIVPAKNVMEKTFIKYKGDLLQQSNYLTKARYKYSAVQKNVLYMILGNFQDILFTKVDLPELIKMKLYFKDFEEHGNYKRFLGQLKALASMPIDYEYNRLIDKEKNIWEKNTGFVNLFAQCNHRDGDTHVDVALNAETLKVMTSIVPGFTTFTRKIALELNSTYSKRMYEIMSAWKDKNGFTISLVLLKQMLGVDEKYEKYSAFQKYVLEAAKIELKNKADLYYEYSELKRGRKIERLKFKVILKNGNYQEMAKEPQQKELFDKNNPELRERCIGLLKEYGIVREDLVNEIVNNRQDLFFKWNYKNKSNLGKYANPSGVLLKHLGMLDMV